MAFRCSFLLPALAMTLVLYVHPSTGAARLRNCALLQRGREHLSHIKPERIRLDHPRCQSGRLAWSRPVNKQLVIFFYTSARPFSFCLTVESVGSHVFRLLGPSQRLVANSTTTGHQGCFDSRCGHVSLVLEADPSAIVGRRALVFSYETKMGIRCPRCTESCQRDCLCTEDYMFIGKVAESRYDYQASIISQIGHYEIYLKIGLMIKYGGVYLEQLQVLNKSEGKCGGQGYDNKTNLIRRSIENDYIPKKGRIRVYTKCPLKINRTYMVAGSLFVGRTGGAWLVVCCADDDVQFAQSYLDEVLWREGCCS